MINSEELRNAILEKLSSVIDPETGVDVVRMRLIEDLVTDESGRVSYTFRPSSVFCPIAVPLADAIRRVVDQVPGVTSQEGKVVGFALADELTAWLKQAMDRALQEKKQE